MRSGVPAYDPSFYHSLIAICAFIVFFGYLGFHTLRGSEVVSLPVKVTAEESSPFLLTCNFHLHRLDKEPSNHYRLSLSNSNESFPISLFPFPKVFKEEKDRTAQSLRKLLLNEQYLIILSSGFPIKNHLVLNQFCSSHNSIELFSSLSSISPFLSVQTIEILSLSTVIDDKFAQRFSDYEIPWTSNRELYYLKISANGSVQLAVNDELGINLGFATLSQLIYSPSSVAFPVEIIDWPENDWRGLMIDVSRHYQPIKLLKRTIEGMQANKLNLLHLHLTDAQSFPVLLEDDLETGIPLSQLAEKSAFSLEKIYTKDELKDLVFFAKERNIEIIPEIDIPAHSYSWGKAFDDIIVRCDSIAKSEQNPLNVYPLDPSNPLTFIMIKAILKQILEIFPSRYLHIGGDEVNERCWSEVSHVITWSKEKNIVTSQITKYFENEVFKIVKDLGKIPIVWQGVFDSNAIPSDEEDEHRNGEKGGNHPHLRHQNNPHRQGRTPASSSSGSSSSGFHNELRRNNRSTQNHRVLMRGRRLSSSSLTDLDKPSVLLNFHRTNHSSSSFSSSSYSLPSESSFVNSSHESFKAIIEPWKCWSGLAIRTATRAMKSKHPVFMSACWYLDFNSDWINFLTLNLMDSTELQYQNEQQSSSSSSQSPFSTSSWPFSSSSSSSNSSTHTASENKPDSNPLLSSSQHNNYFVGGEGALWTESVDCTNYECRVWPRMSAVAYRLWGLGPYFCELSLLHDFESIPSSYRLSSSFHYYYYFCSHYFTYSLISKVLVSSHTHTESHINQSTITSSSSFSALRRPSLPFHNERIEIPINNLLTKLLYASYSSHRYYLSHHLKINAASLTLHYPVDVREREKGKKSIPSFFSSSSSSSNSGNKEKPVLVPSFPVKFDEIFNEIEKINRGLLFTSSGGVFYSEPTVSSFSDSPSTSSSLSDLESIPISSSRYVFHISSQCLGIPEVIQRPVTSSSLSIMQFNIADGSVGERGENMLKWLQAKAKEGIAFIGFCELVGWNSIFSKTDISKNLPLLTMRSANAGFIYSYLTPYSSTSSYPVGIVSIYPFTVVKEYVFPLFQRVILHVYFEKFNLNVFICHFHAHSAEERNKETLYLVKEILTPLLKKKKKHNTHNNEESNVTTDEEARIIVMGDLNSLSPYDKQQHNENHLTTMIEENSRKSSLFQRWKKKFLKSNMNNAVPEIDYRPIENLLKYDNEFLFLLFDLCLLSLFLLFLVLV
jgi:endonuclease/exonuclease/phosphatase family metal-dependent hydrolase